MTKKEFFKAVSEGTISEEIKNKALELLKKEEDRTAERGKAQTENKNKNIELARLFAERIGNRTLAASEIYTLCNNIEGVSSLPKVSAVCRVGVEVGIFTVCDNYKVGGKGSKVKGYTPISTSEQEEND